MNTVPYKEINNFLSAHSLGTIATLSAEIESPEAGIVYYVTDEKRHIYFATSKDSKKLINIQKHENVAFVVTDNNKPIEIQIGGTAHEIVDASLKSDMINRIALVSNDNPETRGWPPLLTLSMKSGITCVEVTIERFKYSDFRVHPGTISTGVGKELLFNYS